MSEQPPGQMEFRSARTVDVRFKDREIEVIVMPYEEEGLVPYGNRLITEICSRGAFHGIERRANRIKANRDHDVFRSVGRAFALHPSRIEGLVADLRISQTDLGDETLALAADGVLDASAGFLPMGKDGEKWETRDRRRLNHCWLGHIAFTSEPVYEGAQVLNVRHTDKPVMVGTPVLDRILAERLAERYHLT